MKKNTNKVLAVSLLSALYLGGSLKASAMMRKAISNAASSASRVASTNSRVTSQSVQKGLKGSNGQSTMSYSKYVAMKKEQEKSKILASQLLTEGEKGEVGNFKTTNGDIAPLRILTTTNEEGMEYKYLKTENEDKLAVMTSDGLNYAPTLSISELLGFVQNNEGSVHRAFDKLGKRRFVMLTGTDEGDELIALQLDTGVYRNAIIGEDGKIHLGNVADLSKLSKESRENAKGLIDMVSKSSSALEITTKKGYVDPQPQKSTELPQVLQTFTKEQIKTLKESNVGRIQGALDDNGVEKSVVILGQGSERVAFDINEGKFYTVGLSKKGKIKLENIIERENVSENNITVLKGILNEFKKQSTAKLRDEASIPRLTESEIEKVKTEGKVTFEKLKDSNGVEKEVIVVGGELEKVSYNPSEGSLNKIRKSKKGNLIVEESVSMSSLSNEVKDELEEKFEKLNIGYTKSADSITEKSKIVGGARRKTTLLKKPTAQEILGEKVEPTLKAKTESLLMKGEVFTREKGVVTVDVYKTIGSDGLEVNYIIKEDGSRANVTRVEGNKFVANSILNEDQIKVLSEKTGKVITAFNARNLPVTVVIMELTDGQNVAYDLKDGIFRKAVKDAQEGVWKLKGKVNLENLSITDRRNLKSLIIYMATL